jgi:protein ImuB
MVTLGEDDGVEPLAKLVDRLGGRLGEHAVSRLVARDAHVPERASARRPMGQEPAASAPWAPLQEEGAPPSRPILILERPEPIQTLAALPDGPPLRFRWRRALHDVARVEGPERIAPPWWGEGGGWARAQALTRDYFRAEDRQGRRFWLYREGLFGAEIAPGNAPSAPPRWFLHGLFG